MVGSLRTVLFARLSILARTEGQAVTQHIERYFCVILSILFSIQDVKCRSRTQDWKKPNKFQCYFSSNYVQYFEATFQFMEWITANTRWESELKIQTFYFIQLQLTIWALKACLSTPCASAKVMTVGSALYKYKLRKCLKEAGERWLTDVRD